MQAMMIWALVLAGQNMHFGQWYYGPEQRRPCCFCTSSG